MTGSHLSGQSFESRKRFGCFGEDDAALLAELREAFERHADRIVTRFYEHLMQVPALRRRLSDPVTVKRLKISQRAYLLSLASGDYGESHMQDRQRIGRVHAAAGLEPEWYLGSYGLYLDLLRPAIHERFGDDAEKSARAHSALAKLIILDAQIVLDAYYGIQQRKAVERSEELAAVGELAASIAHEVRNPLAGMKGALQVLRKELAVRPQNLEIVDELLAQIERLEHLVRDLLTYARPHVVERRMLDLHELLDRLLRLFKDQADTLGVTVHRIYGPATGQLDADPRQIEQIFLNLLQNALQAMEDGGTLRVTTQTIDGAIAISFSDTGKGICATDLHRIFDPFHTTKHRGSGLGLSIVKKIAEAHGGAVEVASELGRGTTATVTIPR